MTALQSGAAPTTDEVDSVLLSKMSVPKEGVFLLPRRWLFDQLTQGAERPLTVVSGPAGWGKTTLVASWVAHDLAPGHVAWLTLDREDDDAVTFWTGVVDALVLHGACPPGQLHRPAAPAVGHTFLAELSASLGRSEETVVLVLDGFESITHPLIHRDLDALLRSAASDLRLVLTTRDEPEALLDSYRHRDEPTVIRTSAPAAAGS